MTRSRDEASGTAWIGACLLASHVGHSHRKRRTGQIHLGRTNADRRAAPGYDQNVFAQVPNTGTPVAVLPPNRTLSYRFVAFEVLQDDFRKVGDQNQIGRTEDLYFGTHLYAEIGYSAATFDANQNDMLFTTSAAKGFQLSELTRLFLSSTINLKLGGRRSGITSDLYGYHRYKTWMQKTRSSWEYKK